jgi:DNA modification methylase
LICGDANVVIPRLVKEGIEVDMVFCSPNPIFHSLKDPTIGPVDVGSETKMSHYLAHLENIFKKVYLLLKDSGSLWIHMADAYMMRGSMPQVPERFAIQMVESHIWFLRGKRVWIRGEHEIPSEGPKNMSPWNWEPIYWFTKQEDGYVWNDGQRCAYTSVVNAPFEGRRADGGSGFPYKVINEAMYMTTKPGDTVLDCFVGSGETGIAALQEGRKFIGIDISADKIALAQRRLRLVSPSKSS